METKHFVEFKEPGAFFAESYTEEIPSSDLQDIVLPNRRIHAFSTFDKVYSTVTLESGEETQVTSGRINEKFYQVGTFMSLEEIAEKYGETSMLYRNVKNNDFAGAIIGPAGNASFPNDNATLLSPDQLKYSGDQENE